MSSGLMSCVRENSPPLELELSAAGPLSLPEGKGRSHGFEGPTTSTPIACPRDTPRLCATVDGNCSMNAEQQQKQQQQQQQQKRRRFHPLRNLRRIFRRRTINSADTVAAGGLQAQVTGAGSCNTLPPPTSSSSEKNLRSVALPGASTVAEPVTASSPASPLTHQQLHESYQTQSLPKSKSYGAHRDELLSVLLGKKRANKPSYSSEQPQAKPHSDAMYQTPGQQMGVAVFPDAMSMSRSSYFPDKRYHARQLRSFGDSAQDADAEHSRAAGGAGGADMSDSQRSLSEGRLLDADVDGGYTRETLSQSHDSVFSESATASSLSIVLKAELTDVLRKRRNRPDASDEDLGLPRSPSSPQRHGEAGQSRKAAGYQPRGPAAGGHEVSSLSLVSVNSTDGEDSQGQRQHSSKSISSSDNSSSVVLREHVEEDGVDAVGSDRHRLSHAAARHKMAIRPAKKKGPTRQHRRTLETSIPEANEELLKIVNPNPSLRTVKEADLKTKTRSLPPGSSLTAASTATLSRTVEQRSTATSSSSSSSCTTAQAFGLRALTLKAANALFDVRGESSTDGDDVATGAPESSDQGFLRRLMQRNSKRTIARANDGLEDVDASQNLPKKLQISTSCVEVTSRQPVQLPNKSRSATTHEQHIQETRQTIRREIQNEGRYGLNALVSNYGVQPQPPTAVKPRSGPAARQRYMPKELGAGSPPASSTIDVTSLLSKGARGNDIFQSTALVREQTNQLRTDAGCSGSSLSSHFERKPRIVGISAFQQKLSRSSDSVGQHSSSSNSLETSTDEPSPLYYEEKQRKTVEKSRSFRNYQDEPATESGSSMHSNMPSLPDLSISFRVPSSHYKQSPQSPLSPLSPMSPMSPSGKCASLGFEINDNKLLQARAESTGKLPSPSKVSPQRNSTLLVPSPGPANISQIEQNIDLIVKSPMVSLLRKSGAMAEQSVQPVQPEQPTQRPKILDLKQTTASVVMGSPTATSPLTKGAKLSGSPPSTPGKGQSLRQGEEAAAVGSEQPEFMKIQLNRVDQARLHSKANHLVLAKNVKAAASPAERSQSSDDLTAMRRVSSESTASPAVQVVEQAQKHSPLNASSSSRPSHPLSINSKPPAEQRANSLRSSNASGSSGGSSSGSSSGGSSEVLATPSSPAKGSGAKAGPEAPQGNANRFSVEERKRLFLSEEKAQAERKLAELRNERKKSINEELQRKPDATSPSDPDASNGNGGGVVLRKKSFGSSNGNGSGQEDATPELMKVFARRSLKVKDDDAVALAQIAVANHKKISNGSQSLDSDKENQSNSEEKLDKLTPNGESPKLPHSNSHSHAHPHAQPISNNRCSVADFRNLNNNGQPGLQKISNLPPIKVSNSRNSANSNSSNNNASNNKSITIAKPANDRFSLQLKPATTSIAPPTTTSVATAAAAAADSTATPTMAIERSATVGEFKGIHQRRAEWEQRVKEALK